MAELLEVKAGAGKVKEILSSFSNDIVMKVRMLNWETLRRGVYWAGLFLKRNKAFIFLNE